MRAKTVNESQHFERHGDPRKSMKIGTLYAPKKFASALKFAQFIFDHLEEITGYKPSKSLSNNLVGTAFYSIDDFWEKLKSYFLNCPHTIRGKPINDSYHLYYWGDININLQKILLSLDESYAD